MDIEQLKRQWESFGESDPLWAILTARGRERGGWDTDEFLRTGEEEVREQLGLLEERGIEVPRGRALDFGCGAGRLTQALAERFDSCDGVDISAPMIELARGINRHGERCRYHVQPHPNLRLFPDRAFDLVISRLVLQHMRPHYALAYVREFMRVLAPGGVALFQAPARKVVAPPLELPAAAVRATVELEEDPPPLEPGQSATLQVRVRNASELTWPADAQVRAGNHWRDGGGQMLVFDDGRADVASELAPGAEATVDLTVTAPGTGGPWLLELDVLQEHVRWFDAPLRVPVRRADAPEAAPAGSDGARAAPAADDGFQPVMPMYTLPRAELEAFVESCGGRVLDAIPDQHAGEAFEGFTYVVTRGRVSPAPPAVDRLAEILSAVPDRPDMLPPITSARRGRRRELELAFKRAAARAGHWITWLQVEHDRAVAHALTETQAALAAHEAELRRLRAELERRDGGDPPVR